ncbi:DUF4829 domain-containing protein [Desulfosporosinus sp. SB140]|uniref:DUF4829 domain-containing protein n=1 Tax=Desulfosporosinus paludis TaxID=3115649 RepID=UPI00388E0DB4
MKFVEAKIKLNQLSKMIILFIMFVILVAGCSSKTSVTQDDINQAKKVVTNFFMALQSGNYDEANKALGRYMKGLYTADNISKWKPRILSIEYPGRFTNSHIPPESYKANYGRDPYKSMNLYVEFMDETGKQGWDYILIKETKDSPWEIHDWGQ